MGAGSIRFMPGPPSTNTSLIKSVSGSTLPASSLFWRFETAERTTFSATFAACFGAKCRMLNASGAGGRGIRSITSRILRGDEFTYLLMARASSIGSACGGGRRFRFKPRMPAENARRGELAELVSDHSLVDVHGDELVSVVDGERQPYKFRRDRRRTRPGLDHLLGARLRHRLDFRRQACVDVRPFFERSAHGFTLPLFPALDNVFRRAELVVPGLLPLRVPSTRRNGMGVALGRFSLAAAVRMVDGVLDHAARLGADAQPPRAPRFSHADVLVVDVAHDADRREAFLGHVANLSRREPELCVFAFLRHHLNGAAGAPCDLPPLARLELHIVDERPHGDVRKRHGVRSEERRVGKECRSRWSP